jgi:DNA-binding NtrC family response regulator
MKILIVDDEPSIAILVSMMIEELRGCFVDTANDPGEAFELLENAYDIVVSDFNLKHPIFNGVDILLYARARYPNVGTVLMSADFGIEILGTNIDEAKEKIDFFLDKPFNMKKIKEAIDRVLQENK